MKYALGTIRFGTTCFLETDSIGKMNCLEMDSIEKMNCLEMDSIEKMNYLEMDSIGKMNCLLGYRMKRTWGLMRKSSAPMRTKTPRVCSHWGRHN